MRPTPAGREAGPGDPGIDLGAGQLAALPGLGALGHLDLELPGVDQVLARDAEAAGGDLLDRGILRVPVGQGLVAGRDPRRPRRCCSCRRCGSWRWPAFHAPPG